MKDINGCIKNWHKMEGATPLIKKINAYVSETFVSRYSPADECIAYAQKAVKAKNIQQIKKMLDKSFRTGTNAQGKKVSFNEPPSALTEKASQIIWLLIQLH